MVYTKSQKELSVGDTERRRRAVLNVLPKPSTGSTNRESFCDWVYIVNYLETAKGTYFKLIPADKKLLIKRVIEERLTQDPQAFGKPLRGSLKGHYRLRIEDYRIIQGKR
jgi:mRNA-degrading endonuclease RelE of RelBE toxin-antitoxin system